MKKILKLAAMFAAALAICVACTEKVEEDAPLGLDGKQWTAQRWVDKVDGKDIYTPVVLDFGVTVPGTFILGQSDDNGGYFNAFDDDSYEIIPNEGDETSGTIVLMGVIEWTYTDLTKNSVTINGGDIFLEDNTKATISTKKLTISME